MTEEDVVLILHVLRIEMAAEIREIIALSHSSHVDQSDLVHLLTVLDLLRELLLSQTIQSL
jgi:hypothetical protein